VACQVNHNDGDDGHCDPATHLVPDEGPDAGAHNVKLRSCEPKTKQSDKSGASCEGSTRVSVVTRSSDNCLFRCPRMCSRIQAGTALLSSPAMIYRGSAIHETVKHTHHLATKASATRKTKVQHLIHIMFQNLSQSGKMVCIPDIPELVCNGTTVSFCVGVGHSCPKGILRRQENAGILGKLMVARSP
jgi:hypothetical protein